MMKEKENRKKQLCKKKTEKTHQRNTTKKNHARKKYHNINKCMQIINSI